MSLKGFTPSNTLAWELTRSNRKSQFQKFTGECQKSIPTTSHVVNGSNCRTQLLAEESRLGNKGSNSKFEVSKVNSQHTRGKSPRSVRSGPQVVEKIPIRFLRTDLANNVKSCQKNVVSHFRRQPLPRHLQEASLFLKPS